MWGKLLYCTLLCLATAQLCLALPQQPQIDESGPKGITDYPETRITSCRASLRQIVATVATLGYDFGVLYAELLAAFIETIKCILSANVNCEATVLSDTVAGIRDAISDFATNIVHLGETVGQGVQNCLLKGNSIRFEQLY